MATVFIAGLRSSGSTLLSELLTELPRSFVFREPALLRGRLILKDDDVERLLPYGIDLRGVEQTRERGDSAVRARTFREQVLEPASAVLDQVGFKEIRYEGGGGVDGALAALGNVKVIVLARDPRDMYISLAHRRKHESVRGLRGQFGPDAVVADVEPEIRAQARLLETHDCLPVRYEDLCRDPAVIARVRQHVGSPVQGDGAVGLFKENNRRVHGRAMTVLRVERHSEEPDGRLVEEATEVARRLGDYCERWGYEP